MIYFRCQKSQMRAHAFNYQPLGEILLLISWMLVLFRQNSYRSTSPAQVMSSRAKSVCVYFMCVLHVCASCVCFFVPWSTICIARNVQCKCHHGTGCNVCIICSRTHNGIKKQHRTMQIRPFKLVGLAYPWVSSGQNFFKIPELILETGLTSFWVQQN